VSLSAVLLGVLAKCLRRSGINTEWVLAGVLGLWMAAQAGLLVGCPLPSYLLWSQIAAAGAATVLSFAILTEYFPKEMSGRANAALNLLHVGIAFLLQTGAGLIIAEWPQSAGPYPAEAHRPAMAGLLGLELSALVWFGVAGLGSSKSMGLPKSPRHNASWRLASVAVIRGSARREYQPHSRAIGWHFAAASAALVCLTLLTSLSRAISHQ